MPEAVFVGTPPTPGAGLPLPALPACLVCPAQDWTPKLPWVTEPAAESAAPQTLCQALLEAVGGEGLDARQYADVASALLGLAAERDAWQQAWQAAQHTATHDHLTGLPNRGVLFDRLDHAIATGARRGRAVAVLFIDIDDFKVVNDRFGHAVGDATLVEVARRLAQTLRANDTLVRLSGDEFVVVCEDMDAAGAPAHAWLTLLAQRILRELRRRPAPGETDIDVSVSIGAAVTTRECSAQTLMNQADEAMYAAKRAGGGRLVVSRGRPTPRGRSSTFT